MISLISLEQKSSLFQGVYGSWPLRSKLLMSGEEFPPFAAPLSGSLLTFQFQRRSLAQRVPEKRGPKNLKEIFKTQRFCFCAVARL